MTSILLTLYILALCASAVNAAYFGALPAQSRGRRIGALVLALVNTGTALHSARGAIIALLAPPQPESAYLATAILVQSVVALGSLAVTILILRRALSGQSNP